MKELTSTKSSYLLEASLEILHEENQEWLSEIDFWIDEVSFFINLLRTKHIKAVLEGKTEIFNESSKKLYSYQDKSLPELKFDVTDHEKKLANILKENKISEETDYREIHKELFYKIENFSNELKKVKKDFFIVLENWP